MKLIHIILYPSLFFSKSLYLFQKQKESKTSKADFSALVNATDIVTSNPNPK